MSIQALTTVIMLASAQVNPGTAIPAEPVVIAASATPDPKAAPPTADAPAPLPASSSIAPPFIYVAAVQPLPGAVESNPDEAVQNEIVVEGVHRATPGDPLERLNAKSFEVVQDVDKAFVAPVAKAYEDILPKPVRGGLRNFLRNLDEPIVAVNYLLQLKPHAAVRTIARFAVNSTIGVAGLIDVAKEHPFDLPYRPNGFANTMGYYGVKPGPYMFLPIIGPTTLRDVVGLGLDRGFVPTLVGAPFTNPGYGVGGGVVRSLDYRVECDATLRSLREDSGDSYAATRAYYLATRQAEIDLLRGKIPVDAPPGCGTRAVRSSPTVIFNMPAPPPLEPDAGDGGRTNMPVPIP